MKSGGEWREMSVIEWQSAYETGIEKIDEHHKKFVAMINQLEQSICSSEAEAEAHDVMVKLVKYVQYHFAEEEQLMAEHKYTDTDQHAIMHQQFTHRVADFLKRLKTDGSISAQDLLSFLKSHLIDHIMREDTKLRSLKLPTLLAR